MLYTLTQHLAPEVAQRLTLGGEDSLCGPRHSICRHIFLPDSDPESAALLCGIKRENLIAGALRK